MAARYEERLYEKYNLPMYVFSVVCFATDFRTMTSGGGGKRGTVFQEVRQGAGFETGDFVKEMLGGGYRRRTTPPVDEKIP